MDVVDKIEKVAVDSNDHPVDDVKIEKIELKKK
jgi:cyclophilin family peptidyl-prolyl cis-trans isomerase